MAILNNCIKMDSPRHRIHIIANCANRKRVPPAVELNSISQTDIKQRVAEWWERLNDAPVKDSNSKNFYEENKSKVKAEHLYIGSYWSTIRRLSDRAQHSGFDANLWIISAGYGLISSSDEVLSYSATFTRGDKNSVTSGGTGSISSNKILSQWWELISNYSLPQNSNPRKISQLFQENPSDCFLVIASEDYLCAIGEDLLKGIDSLSSTENIIIITSKSFTDEKLENYIISTDARLQCNRDCSDGCEKHLIPRGVRGTISASLADKIIEKIKVVGFNAQKLKQFVEERIEKSPALITFNRTRLNDIEVRNFIDEQLERFPSASCSYLLRKLRDNNLACEQKRFRELYKATKRSTL